VGEGLPIVHWLYIDALSDLSKLNQSHTIFVIVSRAPQAKL
jgi:hypothetical protein